MHSPTLLQRQGEIEGRAGAGRAFNPQFTAVSRDDMTACGKAQADALDGIACRLRPAEGSENPIVFLARDTYSLVGDLNHDFAPGGAGAYGYASLIVGILDRV
jgi:hypothetical protein